MDLDKELFYLFFSFKYTFTNPATNSAVFYCEVYQKTNIYKKLKSKIKINLNTTLTSLKVCNTLPV
jgi:hypothetical protein